MRVIRTVQRKGYRFVAEVRELPAPVGAPNSPARDARKDAAETTDAPPTKAQAEAVLSERRAMTILACSIRGSADGGAAIDPEQYAAQLEAWRRIVREAVLPLGGTTGSEQQDRTLICFGYPQAHENDAERATRAGLALLAASVEDTGHQVLEGTTLRLAIASGPAVVSRAVSEGYYADQVSVVGEVASRAADLAARAPARTLLVCDATRRQLASLFDVRRVELGDERPGPSAQVVWHVHGPNEFSSRLDATRSVDTPFVGRTEELDLIARRWTQALSGRGQVVTIVGEAGIGKSRLGRRFRRSLEGSPHTTLHYQCSPFHLTSPLYPVIGQLERAAGITAADTVASKLAKLRGLLADSPSSEADDFPYFARLLSLPDPESEVEHRHATPVQLKERTLEAILGRLERMCEVTPVLLTIEDLQWIDRSTLDLLTRLVEQAVEMRLLVLTTARPDFQPAWPQRSHVHAMVLNRLGDEEGTRLLQGVAGDVKIAPDVQSQLLARAEGVALFIEELTKAFVEVSRTQEAGRSRTAGPGELGRMIPSTLYGSLLMRMDGLARGKPIARVAAAFGERTSYELLETVAGLAPEEMQEALASLVRAGLLYQRGAPPNATYAFCHVLVQEAIYSTLTTADRTELHRMIAARLEQRSESMAAEPERLARHLDAAGLSERACAFWIEAGRRSARRSAFGEAIGSFERAIARAGGLSDRERSSAIQLEALLGLGPAQMALHGYSAAPGLASYLEAQKIAGDTGSVEQRLEVLFGLFNARYVSADLAEARETAREHLQLAERSGLHLGRSHTLLGQVEAATGAFVAARQSFERAIAEFRNAPEDTAELGAYSSQEVVAHALLAGVLFALGEIEAAIGASARSVEIAQAKRHPFSIGLALATRLQTPQPGGIEPDLAGTEEVVRFCAERGLGYLEQLARFALGAAAARLGDPARGIEIMSRSLAQSEQMNARLLRPAQLATLARAHASLGDGVTASRLLDEAIATAETTGEQQALPGLLRSRAEMFLSQGVGEPAMTALRAAEAKAREQASRFELKRIEKLITRTSGPKVGA
jgi:class 3 adenylate cyclase/tetratricopeptide (TPR) repeat protein